MMIITSKHIKVAKIVCGVIAAVVVGLSAWVFWPEPADIQTVNKLPEKVDEQNAEEVVVVLAKVDFAKLPADKQSAVLEKLRTATPEARTAMLEQMHNLPDDQRQQMRKNMREGFRSMMQERVDAYSKLKTQEEKNKYLDEVIDEMQKHREERRAQRAKEGDQGNNNERRNRWRNMSEDDRNKRRKMRMDTSSPTERAARRQFRMDMMRRMRERGIDFRGRRH